MTPIRAVSLVVAFLAAVGLLFGSFSAAEITSDRDAAIDVADPSEPAYLGFEQVNQSAGDDGDTVVTVAYRNRVTVPIERVEVGVTRGPNGETVATREIADPIPVGQSATVAVIVDCGSPGPGTLAFHADAAGPGFDTETTNTVEFACDATDRRDRRPA